MPIQGSLSTMPVPELLMWISQFRKTGTLTIRTSRMSETIAFEDGALTFSSSSDPEGTLGRLLMRSGVVTEEMHKRAREVRKSKSVAIAKTLLDLQILTEEQLLRFMRKKAEKEISELFDSDDGEFVFIDKDLPLLDLLPMRVDVSKILLRVAQDRDEKGAYDFDASGIHLDIPKDI